MTLTLDNIEFHDGRGSLFVTPSVIPPGFSGIQLIRAEGGRLRQMASYHNGEIEFYVNDQGQLQSGDGTFVLGRAGINVSASAPRQPSPARKTPMVDGAIVTDGSLISKKLTESSKDFSTEIVFSATDYDTVAWSAGELKFADGKTYDLAAGNTGEMTGSTYIYFDPTDSPTTLFVTDEALEGVGEHRVLLCFAKPAVDATQHAFFVPAVGVMGINETVIGPNSVTSGIVKAGSIYGYHIGAGEITAAHIDVVDLESISAHTGSLTVDEDVVIGSPNVAGKLRSYGKTAYGDTTVGYIFDRTAGNVPRFDIYATSTNYLRFDGSQLNYAGPIIMTGGSISWGDVTAPSYGEITGTKPPTNATYGADWTANITNRPPNLVALGDIPGYIKGTYIDANEVSSPEIRGNWVLAGNVIVGAPTSGLTSGMLGNDGGADPLTIYSGETYANRATAPFRTYKSGAVIMSSAKIRTSTGTKYIDIGNAIANEMQFFEGGVSKVRVGSDVYGSGNPGILVSDGTVYALSTVASSSSIIAVNSGSSGRAISALSSASTLAEAVWAYAHGPGQNIAIQGTADGGSSNWAGWFEEGNVYVKHHIHIKGVPYTWPAANAVGTLHNDGSGNLTWS